MKAIFLDRDGVINRKKENGYITSWEDFIFLPKAIQGIKKVYESGYCLFIVTNQQCVGKGLIKAQDLDYIHFRMLEKLNKYKIKIQKIYFCPHMKSDNCSCRKPKTGMIKKALNDFPDIDIKYSFIIGDDQKDIEMGKKAGLNTIFINKNNNVINPYTYPDNGYQPDFIKKDLYNAAVFLASLKN
jgi:histidinol-phosphate phosphatase family protein